MNILTSDSKMQIVLDVAKSVANSKASVMIRGENGTGKDQLANFIHQNSNRRSKNIVSIDLTSIPVNLLETEIFGIERDAFSGVLQRRLGKLEEADGSTIVIHEICELPQHLQAKLLNVILTGEFLSVGAVNSRKVDVRFITTTSRNIESWVNSKKFREDLFYRLNVIPIEIPSLRDRRSDIPSLVNHFIKFYCERNSISIKTVSLEAMQALCSWSWAGNLQELENFVERLVLTQSASVILPNHLSLPTQGADEEVEGFQAGMTISEAERKLILKTLEYTKQNRTKAAKMLGISIRTLRNKLHEYKGANYL